MSDKKPQLHLSRPADRSLEAFKKFMLDLTERLVPGSPDSLTMDEWAEKHKEFWDAVDSGNPKKE